MKLLDLSGRGAGYAADIDPEIVDVVMELNEVGLLTVGSCAGHHGGIERIRDLEGRLVKSRSTGYVNFDRVLSTDEIELARKILEEHGVRGLRFHRQGPYSTRSGLSQYSTEVTFPSLVG